ncbi:MAG: hypothetical protein K2W85_15895 [Phycisphaerales bacterium]|nr:hypothetical protein [Phycisphaerales bacterium]
MPLQTLRRFYALAAITTLAHTPLAHARLGELSFREPGGIEGARSAETTAANTPPLAEGGAQASDFSVRFEPMLFFPALSGDLKLPVRSGTGPGSFTTAGDSFEVDDFNVDESRLSPSGRVAIASGDWLVSFWGFDFQSDVDRTSVGSAGRLGGIVFVVGDQANVDFDFGSYELTVGYRVYDRDFAKQSASPEQAVDVRLNVHLLAGARLYDTSVKVERITPTFASAEAEHTFIEPILGVRTELDITQAFSIQVQGTGGTLPLDDTSSYSFDISASFHYRPVVWADLFIGYRLLLVSLEDGDNLDAFEFDGTVAGLFTGFTIRF